ncbi:MAG: GNAT family N-acetyltransferase [Gammaproteobacteria bacterium]
MFKHNIKIRIADWHTDKDSLAQIRRRVFIEEQNVPEDMEWDEYDNSSIHFIATHKDKVIACARLKTDGQIGRMAVLAEYRNKGIGSKLLQIVLQTARQQKQKNIYLHAQVSAIPFYKKHGFTASGDIFYEAEIPHREMSKRIC